MWDAPSRLMANQNGRTQHSDPSDTSYMRYGEDRNLDRDARRSAGSEEHGYQDPRDQRGTRPDWRRDTWRPEDRDRDERNAGQGWSRGGDQFAERERTGAWDRSSDSRTYGREPNRMYGGHQDRQRGYDDRGASGYGGSGSPGGYDGPDRGGGSYTGGGYGGSGVGERAWNDRGSGDERGGYDQRRGGGFGGREDMGYRGGGYSGAGDTTGYGGGPSGYGAGDYRQGRGMDGGVYAGTGGQSGSQAGEPEPWRRGRGPHAGKGPAGFQRSDERIKEAVCEALADHDDIDASNIDVAVKGGEVTLSGTVDDRRTKRLAEECVECVRGVKDVQNQLRLSTDRDRKPGGSTGSTGSSMSIERQDQGADKKHRPS